MNSDTHSSASFRDPAGFIFFRDGRLYRQVNHCYRADFDFLNSSGLHAELTNRSLLVSHVTANQAPANSAGYLVIAPQIIPFVSYPSEWSFSAFKDAALLTLSIQESAIKFGMTLKDASAYNVQFLNGRPIFIDTLSFTRYEEGQPWVAYRQFCQHFLAPLALMAYVDPRASKLCHSFIDGVPLDLACRMLPWRARLKLGLYLHLFMHARAQQKYADAAATSAPPRVAKMQKSSLLGLLDNLRSTINTLQWKPAGTEWAEYYQNTNYSDQAFGKKKDLVSSFLKSSGAKYVWDLGANTGVFSECAADLGTNVISFDIDPAAVERNYLRGRGSSRSILPIVMDLTNPTASVGWAHHERMSLEERGPADALLALALIHHLAIGNNVPLQQVAQYLAALSPTLIIEFVPKADSQVKRLLASRPDIFPQYTEQGFEEAFSAYFTIESRELIPGTARTLYLLRRK